MNGARDNFSEATIRLMARRVNYRCSKCGQPTEGPNQDPGRYTSVGVGAHIQAAAVGGPRYDANQTPEDRKDVSNGIWVCHNCSDLIDKDGLRFSANDLREFRDKAEMRAAREIGLIPDLKQPRLSVSVTPSRQWQKPRHNSLSEMKKRFGEGPYSVDQRVQVFEHHFSFKMVVENVSDHTAYTLRIGKPEHLAWKITESFRNSIKSTEIMELYLEAEELFTGTGFESGSRLNTNNYSKLVGSIITFEYYDSPGNQYRDEYVFTKNSLELSDRNIK